jgi:O-antigen/teichoic acid export membrane protein
MIGSISRIIREKNILSLITSLLTAFLGLVSFMLLTRSLEKSLFGDWVLFTTLATFTDLLRFGLTSTALVRFSSTDNDDKRKAYLGTSYKIGLIAVGAVAVVLWILLALVYSFNISINNGYLLFLTWYPLLALFNLSWNNSISYFQALQNFKLILYLRLISLGSFVFFLVFNFLYFRFGLSQIMMAFLIINLLPSILVFYKKWDGLMHIRKATSATTKEMLTFGKFSMGTLIGSSLLRSADTIIIGLSPVLGSVGIAQYAIPLKLTDLLGIPLRSFSITAFPKMSKKSLQGDIEGLKKIFNAYSGAVTLLFVPIAIVCFIFAEQLVWFLGGNEYKDSLPLLATIFRIFTVYSILLPIDRFTGVALDSINKPKFNFYKVIIMASANVIGDLIAVFFFQSLEAVALVTVLFTIIGIIAGYGYLSRFIPINFMQVLTEGVGFFKNIKQYL